MQKIALENNLSETAFITNKDNQFFIKWFSPLMEIDLCGHATLAAAHIYFTEINTKANQIDFDSKSGLLKVYKEDDFLYLNFPTDTIKKINIDQPLIEMI
jgi:PhzF family phenazine biosynthesis protein